MRTSRGFTIIAMLFAACALAQKEKWTWSEPPYNPTSRSTPRVLAGLPSFGRIDWKLERLPWITAGPQGGVSGMAMTALNGKVYMAGGYIPGGDETPDRASRETSRWAYSYDPATNIWTRLPDLPERREYPRGLADNRSFYVVGGGEQRRGRPEGWQVSADCFRLDPLRPQPAWERCGELNVPRSHMAAARAGHYLVVAGGAKYDLHFTNPYQLRGETDVLDLRHPNAGWQKRAPIPGPARAWVAGAACGDRFYAIGGITEGSPDAGNETLQYDPETDHWTKRTPFVAIGRGWEGRCYADRYVILIGGLIESTGDPQWNDLAFAYDTRDDHWYKIENTIPGGAVINDVGLAIVGNTIFAAGAEGPKGTHFDYLRMGHIVPAR